MAKLMARGGRRKGAGRKPTGKVAMLVRVKPDVRARLERDAKRARRTLSREIELQLEDAIRKSPPSDARTRALGYLISEIAKVARIMERVGSAKFDWRGNRSDFEAFKYALMRLLDALAPSGEVDADRYPAEGDVERAGRIMADVVLTWARADSAKLHAMGDERGASRGSMFYGLPQAARDLGIGGNK
jgi:hypothetical protein